jgi:hypothetical protein
MLKNGKSNNCEYCEACSNCGIIKSWHILNDASNDIIHIYNTSMDNSTIHKMYESAMQSKTELLKIERQLKHLGIDI